MSVELSVQRGDVMAVSADVLLLKHAQGFYGADSAIISILEAQGSCTRDDFHLPPGQIRLVEARPPGLQATRVLFIGAQRLAHFRYEEMETFATLALEYLRRFEAPIRTLTTTVHGAGYGLDIEEALQALVRGFQKALTDGAVGDLSRIIFVESNPRRAELLEKALAALPSPTLETPQRTATPAKLSPKMDKPRVFVAMPFSDEFEDVYQFGIYDVVRRLGYVCERVDETAITGSIIDQIRAGIENCAFVLADLSGERPNVYLEVGYAWGLQRKVLLLARDGTRLHFDLSHHKCIFYKTIRKLAEELERSIRKLASAEDS